MGVRFPTNYIFLSGIASSDFGPFAAATGRVVFPVPARVRGLVYWTDSGISGSKAVSIFIDGSDTTHDFTFPVSPANEGRFIEIAESEFGGDLTGIAGTTFHITASATTDATTLRATLILEPLVDVYPDDTIYMCTGENHSIQNVGDIIGLCVEDAALLIGFAFSTSVAVSADTVMTPQFSAVAKASGSIMVPDTVTQNTPAWLGTDSYADVEAIPGDRVSFSSDGATNGTVSRYTAVFRRTRKDFSAHSYGLYASLANIAAASQTPEVVVPVDGEVAGVWCNPADDGDATNVFTILVDDVDFGGTIRSLLSTDAADVPFFIPIQGLEVAAGQSLSLATDGNNTNTGEMGVTFVMRQ